VFQRWHWDGDGEHESGPTIPLLLGDLAAGPHRLSDLETRDVSESPRLDVLFLTEDPTALPNDSAATEALEDCPFGGCEDDVCGDANANRSLSIADAWMILNAAVDRRVLRLSACDVNG
jgi:hypothetical protein